MTSDNKQDVKANVLHSIKTHFGRYEGLNKDIERGPGISVGGLKKVEISDVEKEELVVILRKLHTDKEEIEIWQSKWNNEERELKDLEVQLELEAIDEELENIKELAKNIYGNISRYEEENAILMDLLKEIAERKDAILINNKISRDNEKLLSKVKYKIAVAESMINQNVDSAIRIYNENIAELKEILLKEKQKREKYDIAFKEYSAQLGRLEADGISK